MKNTKRTDIIIVLVILALIGAAVTVRLVRRAGDEKAADSSRSVIQEEEAISLTNAVRSTYISAPYIPFSSYS